MTSYYHHQPNLSTSCSLPAQLRWPPASSSHSSSEKGYLSFSELFLQQERERQRESLRRRIAENAKKWTEYHARMKEYNYSQMKSRETAATAKQELKAVKKSSMPPQICDDESGPSDGRRASAFASTSASPAISIDYAWPDTALARSSSISHAEDKLAMQHIGMIKSASSEMHGSTATAPVQVDDDSDEEDEELDAVVDGQLYFRTRKPRASVRDFLPLPASTPARQTSSSPQENRLYAPSKSSPRPNHYTTGGSGASSASSQSSSSDLASSFSDISSSRQPSRRNSERTVDSYDSVNTEATSLSFAEQEAEAEVAEVKLAAAAAAAV